MKTKTRLPFGGSAKSLMLAATLALGSGAALAGPDDRTDLRIAMPTTWASHGPTVNSNFAARVAYSIYDQLVRRDWLSNDDGSGIELGPVEIHRELMMAAAR